jgi:hypothetical protein
MTGWMWVSFRGSGRFESIDANDEELPINGFACEGEIRRSGSSVPGADQCTRTRRAIGIRVPSIVGGNASGVRAVGSLHPSASLSIAASRPTSRRRRHPPRGRRAVPAPSGTLPPRRRPHVGSHR